MPMVEAVVLVPHPNPSRMSTPILSITFLEQSLYVFSCLVTGFVFSRKNDVHLWLVPSLARAAFFYVEMRLEPEPRHLAVN